MGSSTDIAPMVAPAATAAATTATGDRPGALDQHLKLKPDSRPSHPATPAPTRAPTCIARLTASTIDHQPSTINHQPSIIDHRPSITVFVGVLALRPRWSGLGFDSLIIDLRCYLYPDACCPVPWGAAPPGRRARSRYVRWWEEDSRIRMFFVWPRRRRVSVAGAL